MFWPGFGVRTAGRQLNLTLTATYAVANVIFAPARPAAEVRNVGA